MADLEQAFHDVPPVTRSYLAAIVGTTLAVHINYLSPLRLYFSWDSIVHHGQYWRLVSSFFFFGYFSFDFFFHLYFTIRYSRMLEEGSERFRTRPGEYAWFLLLAMGLLTLLVPALQLVSDLLPAFARQSPVLFLSHPLTSAIVYLWARRHPGLPMSFLGLFTFQAPYLPYVLMGFSLLVHSVFPLNDALGLVIGHFYYFGQDVYPALQRQAGRPERRLFDAPRPWLRLFALLYRDSSALDGASAAEVAGEASAAAAAEASAEASAEAAAGAGFGGLNGGEVLGGRRNAPLGAVPQHAPGLRQRAVAGDDREPDSDRD